MGEHPIVTLIDFTRQINDVDWVGPAGTTMKENVDRFEKQRFLLTLARHGGNLPGPSRRPMAFYEALIGVVECQYDELQHRLKTDAAARERDIIEARLATCEDFGDPVFNLFYQRLKKLKWVPDVDVGKDKFLFWSDGYADEIEKLRIIAKENGAFFVKYWNRQCELNGAEKLKIKDCS